MNTQKQPTRRKVSVRQVKLSEQEEGFTFSGIFKGFTAGTTFTQIDPKTGEVNEKQLKSMVLEDKETKERTAFLADRGLEGAIQDSMVKEGDWIEIVKLEKVNLSKGRTMNQYDVYQLS